MGMCRPVLQILIRFQTKKCNYPQPFSDLSLLRFGRKHKNYSNLFRIRIFHFLSYSFGIETIKMFVHSRSYPENHTRFQTKKGKLYIRFQTKIAQKPLPDGAAHTYMAYIRQYPPPPAQNMSAGCTNCRFSLSRHQK